VVGYSEGIAISEKKEYSLEEVLFRGGSLKSDPLKNEAVFDFVNSVQKRYYVIRRLEGAVDRLLSRYKSLCEPCSSRGYGSQGSLNQGDEIQGRDKNFGDLGCSQWGCLHRGCGHRGCSLEQELSRVSTYWKDFLSYKYIMNDAHTRGLLVHLIVLYDALLKVSGAVASVSDLDKELFFEQGRYAFLDVRTLSCRTLDDLLDVVDILSAKSRKLPTLKPSLASQLFFSDFGSEQLDDNTGVGYLGVAHLGAEHLDGATQPLLSSQATADLAIIEVGVAEVVPTGVVPTGVVLENSATANTEPVKAEAANAEPDEQVLHYLVEPEQQGEFLINTTIRFYMIQRLNASLASLAKLTLGRDVSRICAQLLSEDMPSTDVLSVDNFQSPVIRDCLKKMHKEGSLEPLFVVWESVGSYRHIGDSHLIRELLLVAIQVYRLLMKVIAPKQEQDTVQVDEVLSLYGTISSLPLTDLFFLLDEFMQQANSVADAYQQGAAQGWNVTLKHYWWVPPVVIAGCVSLYMRVKQYLGHVQYRQGQVRLLDAEGMPMRR
jgi:hypothetical protein